MATYRLDMTISQAKKQLRLEARDGGNCPVCGQFVKIYRRKVTKSQLLTAAKIYSRQIRLPEESDWVYLPGIPQRSRDFATLAYFGLAEQRPGKREDGGAPGYWRITPEGVRFLEGRGTIQKYRLIYDGRCIGGDGGFVTLKDIAPEFRLDELMEGV